jgi:hypothetical protein
MFARSHLVKLLSLVENASVVNERLLLPTVGISVRYRFNDISVPKPGKGGYYRRNVHYPEKYTIKPVPYTNMAGRDPVTGRVVVGTLGGGLKHPLLWVDYTRHIPEGSPPLVEKVSSCVVTLTNDLFI